MSPHKKPENKSVNGTTTQVSTIPTEDVKAIENDSLTALDQLLRNIENPDIQNIRSLHERETLENDLPTLDQVIDVSLRLSAINPDKSPIEISANASELVKACYWRTLDLRVDIRILSISKSKEKKKLFSEAIDYAWDRIFPCIAYEKHLRALMPKFEKKKREAVYRRFLTIAKPGQDADEIVKKHKKQGVPYKSGEHDKINFDAWWQDEISAIRKKAGKAEKKPKDAK